MLKLLYKLGWFLTVIVFAFFFAINSRFCIMFSCSGNDGVGLLYGILSAMIYLVLLELVRILVIKFHFHKKINWTQTSNIVTIPLIVIAYILGKLNGLDVCSYFLNQ